MLNKIKRFFSKDELQCDSFSLQGKRSYQQDNFYVSPIVSEARIGLVADGVGGHAHGEFASAKTVEVFKKEFEDFYNSNEGKPEDFLNRTALLAAAKVYNKGMTEKEFFGTGTTLSGFFVVGNIYFTLNIGDSRVYHYSEKEKKLKQITEDHSYVGNLLKEGLLSKEESKVHKMRNIVTSSIGMDLKDLKISIKGGFKLEPGDMLIALTDGVHSVLTNSELEVFFNLNKSKRKLPQLIVEKAYQSGSTDNITAVIFKA